MNPPIVDTGVPFHGTLHRKGVFDGCRVECRGCSIFGSLDRRLRTSDVGFSVLLWVLVVDGYMTMVRIVGSTPLPRRTKDVLEESNLKFPGNGCVGSSESRGQKDTRWTREVLQVFTLTKLRVLINLDLETVVVVYSFRDFI